MMYSYLTFPDETMVVHSELRERNGEKYIDVHFERPCDEGGFKSARAELPSYKWLYNEGFSEEDIKFFTEFLEHNAHTLFKYSQEGGIKIA